MKKLDRIDKTVITTSYIISIITLFVTIYPFFYIFIMSISDIDIILSNKIFFIPKEIFLGSYKIIFIDNDIWKAYGNSIFYTVVGTAINIIFTLLAAYPLSREKFFARKVITFMFTLTMFFGGGMIPNFILIYKLGLYNSRAAMVLPHAVIAFYLIICITYIKSNISEPLIEAFKIEGSTEYTIFTRVIIPLSKPMIASLIVFYAVFHWNTYLNAVIYLKDSSLQTLQVYLRKVVMDNSIRDLANLNDIATTVGSAKQSMLYIQIKYAVIVVVILPILFVYPMVQKYFIKGIMVGSLKG